MSDEVTFIEAKNGVEAIEMYDKHGPTLVFMDIIMPEKDGIDALKGIIELDPKAIVIMLSSVGTKSNLKAALSLGASDFIQKPWDLKNLNTVIQKYI